MVNVLAMRLNIAWPDFFKEENELKSAESLKLFFEEKQLEHRTFSVSHNGQVPYD